MASFAVSWWEEVLSCDSVFSFTLLSSALDTCTQESTVDMSLSWSFHQWGWIPVTSHFPMPRLATLLSETPLLPSYTLLELPFLHHTALLLVISCYAGLLILLSSFPH